MFPKNSRILGSFVDSLQSRIPHHQEKILKGTAYTKRSRRLIPLLLAVGLMLTGCHTIPTSGPVYAGLDELGQVDAEIQFSPLGPAQGASKEEIIRGFVAAGASPANDYEVARQFLVDDYAQTWEPSSGVLIDQGTQYFHEGAFDAAGEADVLTVTTVGEVDHRGSYTPARPDTETEVSFQLKRVDNEWRISLAPAKIVLDRNTFVATWTPKPIFFLSIDNRLVSDTRWFSNRGSLDVQVLGELLEGPTVAMASVLHTAFPEGTRLAATSVPLEDGVAQIEFSPMLLTASQDDLEFIKMQIGASLEAVPEIRSFEMRVNEIVVESGSVITAESTVPTSQNQYVGIVRSDVFGPAGGAMGAQIPEIGARVAALQPTAVSLSPDRRAAAVLHGGVVSWVSRTSQATIDERVGLVAPGIDRFGFVWSYSTAEPDTVVVTHPGKLTTRLTLPSLDGSVPVAVRLTQGGARIAVLVADEPDARYSRVLVAGVQRSEHGEPLSIAGGWQPELWVEGSPVDLDWINDQRFGVLTKTADSVHITQGVLGQFDLDSGTLAHAVAVSGGGSHALWRVLDDKGRLFSPQGSGWLRVQGDIDVVAKVG